MPKDIGHVNRRPQAMTLLKFNDDFATLFATESCEPIHFRP